MKRGLSFLIIFAVGSTAVFAQQGATLDIARAGDEQEVSWTTSSGYNYQLDVSADLVDWMDTGIVEPGSGGDVSYRFSSDADFLFFRVRETIDGYNEAFLVLPIDSEEVDRTDGVCFAFDLSVFPELPSRIRVYQWKYNTGDAWEQIGIITEFDEIDETKFVRGSAVWIADDGENEILAAVIDDTGAAVATATRMVPVGENSPPSITITGVTGTSPIKLATQVSDEDDDEIRRVEFYDNGVWIGTDYDLDEDGEFGEHIEIYEIDPFLFWEYDLLRGMHSFTAKAFDSRGAVGETATPFQNEITTGNARPLLTIDSPGDGAHVEEGDMFEVSCTVTDPDGLEEVTDVWIYDVASLDVGVPLASSDTPPFDSITVDTTDWTPGAYTLGAIARNSSGSIYSTSYAQYLSVYVEDPGEPSFAETLVANIVNDESVDAFNKSYTGVEPASGEFLNGIDAGLQFEEGIVLTTGLAQLWNWGDRTTTTDENDVLDFVNRVEPGDSVIGDRVGTENTADAAVLTFDVDCLYGQLEFEYEFGSEEYDDYIGIKNDAFIISVDDVVVSLLPDCSDIVSIQSVHPDGTGPSTATALNEYLYIPNDSTFKATLGNPDILVEYDGMIVSLTCNVFVSTAISHRIRIAIADVNDSAFDSAVFLRKHSVRCVPPTP